MHSGNPNVIYDLASEVTLMLLQYSVDDAGQQGFSVGREDMRAGIIGSEDHQGPSCRLATRGVVKF